MICHGIVRVANRNENQVATFQFELSSLPISFNTTVALNSLSVAEVKGTSHGCSKLCKKFEQTSKELYTHVQCSPTSAGLAQAHLNKSTILRFSDFLLLQHMGTLL